MSDVKKPVLSQEDEQKNSEKEVKKQIDAYFEVAKHRLGRTPTAEEFLQIMSEKPVNETEHQESTSVPMPYQSKGEPEEALDEPQKEPKILGMQVFHGLKDDGGKKVPDPANILFYQNADGQCYDCNQQQWLPEPPDVLEHLHSRPVQYEDTDLLSAIMHGVIDDEDYETLDKAGMISENPKKLWTLTKKLKGQIEELERSKSDSMEKLDKSEDELEEELEDDGDPIESLQDFGEDDGSIDDLIIDDTEEGVNLAQDLPGDNVLESIITNAMSAALTGKQFEDAIRKIVQEELSGKNTEE